MGFQIALMKSEMKFCLATKGFHFWSFITSLWLLKLRWTEGVDFWDDHVQVRQVYFALFTLLNFKSFWYCLVLISYGLLIWNFIPSLSIVFLDYRCHFIMLALLDKWSFDYPIIYDIKCSMVNIKMFTCD